IAGGIVNAVLDPILIFGLDMGVAGAATASLMARITVLLVGVLYVARSNCLPCSIDPREFRKDLSDIVKIAIPAVLTNVATPVGNAYVTASIAGFGDGPVAGFSIIGRVIPVAFGIIFALSGAMGPIIGQNFGAGNMQRVRQTLIDSLLFSSLVVAAISLLLWFAQGYIIEIFHAQPEAASLIQFFCTFIAISFVFNGAHFVTNATFNNLGYPVWSTLTNWGKATVGTIPFVWLGAQWFGAEGALAGQAVGTVIFGIVTVVMALRLTQRLLVEATAQSQNRI
ncbi:MAG: MATE family efflux transporter, partial [Proteobacteria bacterium]|nr:MATE family efflux transporter [Pseudomonadota bacterium]